LRKAQEAIVAKRPYAHRIRDIIASLATRTDANDHPLLAKRTPKKVLLLILTSDRGMCGGFNVNTARATVKYITQNEETHESIELAIIGKKGLEYFRRRPQYAISKEYRGILENIDYEKAKTVGDEVIASYTDEGLDAVLMVYNEFKSAMTQQVIVEQLLPVVPEETLEDDVAATMLDFEYEPSKADVLDEVLPLHVNTQIYRAILESIASEMGARMTAMDAATRNAQELISKLTLKYNRARQAAITTELMEIIGGAEALKG
jgi:F-type H+-transporting ATPase subunit gamma